MAIERQAFQECEDLKRVVFTSDSRLERIGCRCFYKSKLEEIRMPCTLRQIDNGAFESCVRLQQVALNEGLTRIGKSNEESDDTSLELLEADVDTGIFQNSRIG